MNKRKQGAAYERQAAKYLEEKGYRILDNNFYAAGGELDLIAQQGEMLVFVEVKYRSSLNQGYPQEAVTKTKMQRMCRAAEYYLHCHCLQEVACRFDVIAILGEEITHIENAFSIER